MPSVMLRKNADGQITFYVAKKDLEETIVSLEFDTPAKWGGDIELSDGSKYYIEPCEEPQYPVTIRFKRERV